MAYNSYTDDFKARALAVLDLCEGKVKKAADKVSEMDSCPVERLPRSTLANWDNRRKDTDKVKERVERQREKYKDDIAALVQEMVVKALGTISIEELHEADLRDKNAFAGTMLDKLQLLNERPTEIREERSSEPSEFFQNVTEQMEENGET